MRETGEERVIEREGVMGGERERERKKEMAMLLVKPL